MMYDSVLTICVGNICRSPMAEGLLKAQAVAMAKATRVASAGIAAVTGAPADPIAVELMGRRGIDISAHRGRQLTYEMLVDFNLVLVMEARHRKRLEQLAPVVAGRVFTLGHWDGFEVEDPFGSPVSAFEEALEKIELGVAAWNRYFA